MDEATLIRLLEAVGNGSLDPRQGADAVRNLAGTAHSGQVDLGHSILDTDRERRCGHPEIVFGAGKTPEEIVDVMRALHAEHGRALATRIEPAAEAALRAAFGDDVKIDDRARTASVGDPVEATGFVAVISAGTSDGRVAREATITARFLGARVEEFADVGVAGIHRVLHAAPRFREANAIVVAAGMEGALPSVVGGLVDRPVIAVPTSVGYGASFGGLSALLGMLNSCASGVTVVNIDNGFGAGFAAAQINRRIVHAQAAARSTS
ncbi:AIR carboxylase [Planctomycetes bacterium Poly30]|uniref:AIR carboxylase n=1 Tax=Saltatorellus ferox TaxID=2528018 RepID=A0A518F029_9BACT|nr:AIR carboxylase [Planctomycetes bacterium Poly30]